MLKFVCDRCGREESPPHLTITELDESCSEVRIVCPNPDCGNEETYLI